MKKIMAFFVFAMLPMLAGAQGPALSQLGEDIAQIVVPEASVVARNTVVLLDPRTGKTFVVIPTGGGFIYASNGQFVQAVYNGSGYILPSGQYLLVVGGVRQGSAGISGSWLGQGEWTYHGSGAHCYMSMEFEEGADYLFRKGGYFDCSVVGLNIDPARFVKKGTQLLDQDGLVVGSYENNEITLNEIYNNTVDITTIIKINGLHFDYSEIWREKEGSELYNIQGRLFTEGR
ncbi:MAG TPA: hypothetical protein DCL44_07820 [Elusimicrobia bacterium]|nr:hypothetical protein [Elusimicrobiota bacterium]